MLRNKEFRHFAIFFGLIASISTTVGFIIHPAAGIIALSSAAIFGIGFFAFTKARYKSIAQLSDQIDIVLHNGDHLHIDESDEGELAILQSEISKMTLCIREQNHRLKREKEHLADSLAHIAHQLRTPLTSATLILSLLANNPNEIERKAFIRETEELLVHMDWLITSLLKLSRLDAGIVGFQRQQIDINSLVHSALRPFLIPIELHNIDVQIDVPQGITILGDTGWLSEAIQNIIKNCIENTGENGQIKIACQDNPLFTEITIHDSGPGFEKEDLPCIFDRFYRGQNPNPTGYGIGLALCKMIIIEQGGTITAKNHPKGGAIFAIAFAK